MFADRRAGSLVKRRRRQPWPADRPFKILALDGGGIRGVYTAEIMRLSAVFDMIAGTSTGGIVAHGLGLGISAENIAAFYRDDGRKIFPPLPDGALGRLWQVITCMDGPKLKHEELEGAQQRRLEDHLLGSRSAGWSSRPLRRLRLRCSRRIITRTFAATTRHRRGRWRRNIGGTDLSEKPRT